MALSKIPVIFHSYAWRANQFKGSFGSLEGVGTRITSLVVSWRSWTVPRVRVGGFSMIADAVGISALQFKRVTMMRKPRYRAIYYMGLGGFDIKNGSADLA